MKKRLLSWLMVLTLCLTLLPTAALADTGAGESSGSEKHEHYLCGATGESHSCSSTWDDTKHEFEAWTSNNSLPKYSDRYYYLTTDVVLTKTEILPQDLVLCLNGHSIKMLGRGETFPRSTASSPTSGI